MSNQLTTSQAACHRLRRMKDNLKDARDLNLNFHVKFLVAFPSGFEFEAKASGDGIRKLVIDAMEVKVAELRKEAIQELRSSLNKLLEEAGSSVEALRGCEIRYPVVHRDAIEPGNWYWYYDALNEGWEIGEVVVGLRSESDDPFSKYFHVAREARRDTAHMPGEFRGPIPSPGASLTTEKDS